MLIRELGDVVDRRSFYLWLQESRRVGHLRGDLCGDEAWLCVHERMLAELLSSLVGGSGPEVGFISHYLSASWPSGSPQALALPVCAASSRKLAPGPPASSTLTRLTLSARSAPPPCPASPTRRRSRPSTSFWWKWTVSACHQLLLCGEKCFQLFQNSCFLGGFALHMFIVPEPYNDAHRHFIFLPPLVCIVSPP